VVSLAILACSPRRDDAPAPSAVALPPAAPVAAEPLRSGTGPMARVALFGPYETRHGYCAARAKCCCEPAISALAAPVAASGPWRSVDLVRAPTDAGVTGPWHLLVRTDRGWFGELFLFVRFEGDVPQFDPPRLEIRDWLGLGSPQIVVHIAYKIASRDTQMRRETIAIVGVGRSGIPTYFTVPAVHVDERAGTRVATSWELDLQPRGRGVLAVTTISGSPSPHLVQLGETSIDFP
jgi:hypothetical protein